MKIIPLQTVFEHGPDKVATVLFDGPRRKLIEITLRNDAALSAHKAPEPIAIQCIAGQGTLAVGDESIALAPGVIVTLEANEIHAVEAQPALILLLTRFIAG